MTIEINYFNGKIKRKIFSYVAEILSTYLALVIGPEEKQSSINARVSNSIVQSFFLYRSVTAQLFL